MLAATFVAILATAFAGCESSENTGIGSSTASSADSGGDRQKKKSNGSHTKRTPVKIDAKPNLFATALAVVADNFDLAIEKIHDGTGWMLGKAEVRFERFGDIDETDERIANYRIYVSNGDESFETEIKAIACDEFGIPTGDSQAKIDEAVEKIKTMLAKLQN